MRKSACSLMRSWKLDLRRSCSPFPLLRCHLRWGPFLFQTCAVEGHPWSYTLQNINIIIDVCTHVHTHTHAFSAHGTCVLLMELILNMMLGLALAPSAGPRSLSWVSIASTRLLSTWFLNTHTHTHATISELIPNITVETGWPSPQWWMVGFGTEPWNEHLLFHTQIEFLNLLLQCCLQFALLHHVLDKERFQDEGHKDTVGEGRQNQGWGQVKIP